jgi:hypothetical protein
MSGILDKKIKACKFWIRNYIFYYKKKLIYKARSIFYYIYALINISDEKLVSIFLKKNASSEKVVNNHRLKSEIDLS